MYAKFQYNFSNLKQNFSQNFEKSNTFDSFYKQKWKELHNIPGVFRYTLAEECDKVLPGKYGFLLQLNPDRSTKRRIPDEITSLKQKFNPDKFNFTKISDAEYLFQIQQIPTEKTTRDMLIINSSPICFNHSLLCPDMGSCLPQVITLRSLILATHIMFLSSDKNLRIGFNSLCAMASVNHLHYHLLVVNHRLPTETVKCHKLQGPIYTIDEDYPAHGFCFQMKTKDEIESVCLDVFKLTSYLSDNNIAHNLYMMVGESLDGSNNDVLRIFVWARESSVGIKDLSGISLALCEFSGQFPVRSQVEFNKLTADYLTNVLRETTKSVFHSICLQIRDLYP